MLVPGEKFCHISLNVMKDKLNRFFVMVCQHEDCDQRQLRHQQLPLCQCCTLRGRSASLQSLAVCLSLRCRLTMKLPLKVHGLWKQRFLQHNNIHLKNNKRFTMLRDQGMMMKRMVMGGKQKLMKFMIKRRRKVMWRRIWGRRLTAETVAQALRPQMYQKMFWLECQRYKPSKPSTTMSRTI